MTPFLEQFTPNTTHVLTFAFAWLAAFGWLLSFNRTGR